MTNFIIGMLVGMATLGVIIIVVDQLTGLGVNINTNPKDIIVGIVEWIRVKANTSAKKFAEHRVKQKFADEDEYYSKHSRWNPERIDAMESVFEVEDELAEELDLDMEFVDRMVDFCEGKG